MSQTLTAPLVEIPLTASPQRFAISLSGVMYRLTFTYRDADLSVAGGCGWVLDIADLADNPIVCGIPLVTGADLLAQYAYLNLNGVLFVYSDGDFFAPPTFENIGDQSHLMWISTS